MENLFLGGGVEVRVQDPRTKETPAGGTPAGVPCLPGEGRSDAGTTSCGGGPSCVSPSCEFLRPSSCAWPSCEWRGLLLAWPSSSWPSSCVAFFLVAFFLRGLLLRGLLLGGLLLGGLLLAGLLLGGLLARRLLASGLLASGLLRVAAFFFRAAIPWVTPLFVNSSNAVAHIPERAEGSELPAAAATCTAVCSRAPYRRLECAT